jgi:hypothetical protein
MGYTKTPSNSSVSSNFFIEKSPEKLFFDKNLNKIKF